MAASNITLRKKIKKEHATSIPDNPSFMISKKDGLVVTKSSMTGISSKNYPPAKPANTLITKMKQPDSSSPIPSKLPKTLSKTKKQRKLLSKISTNTTKVNDSLLRPLEAKEDGRVSQTEVGEEEVPHQRWQIEMH